MRNDTVPTNPIDRFRESRYYVGRSNGRDASEAAAFSAAPAACMECTAGDLL